MIKQLSQDEVDSLPEGTPVVIRWSGGIEPALYNIHRKAGLTYVICSNGFILKEPVDAGFESYSDQVWLYDPIEQMIHPFDYRVFLYLPFGHVFNSLMNQINLPPEFLKSIICIYHDGEDRIWLQVVYGDRKVQGFIRLHPDAPEQGELNRVKRKVLEMYHIYREDVDRINAESSSVSWHEPEFLIFTQGRVRYHDRGSNDTSC